MSEPCFCAGCPGRGGKTLVSALASARSELGTAQARIAELRSVALDYRAAVLDVLRDDCNDNMGALDRAECRLMEATQDA